mgnify:CR=1 FL=1
MNELATSAPVSGSSSAPKVGFVSLGCPKALTDSELILTQLRAEGYETSKTFAGADLVDRLPVFRYSAGGLEVGESFKAQPDGKGIQRHFTVATHKPLALAFPANAKISITSNRGTLAQGVLRLTADEARDFTLTQTFR